MPTSKPTRALPTRPHLPLLHPPKALLAALLLAATASAQVEGSRLGRLAHSPGVTGDEQEIAQVVRRLLGPGAQIDNTNSAYISFGEGSPHTLIAAGLDEPGFAVSGFTEEGYVRVQSLGEDRLARYFLGQPVTIHGLGVESGVVAAPSVHFKSDRGYAPSGLDQIFIDVGAESREQARERVEILDRVRLRAEAFRLGPDRLVGPWISSRAGAAILVELAMQLRSNPPPHRVTLAAVAGQYADNPGLLRALRRDAPERVIVVRPGGPAQPTIQAAEGWESALRDELLASPAGEGFERGGAARIPFGPFGPRDPWPDADQSVAVTLGVENAGSPVEFVYWTRLARVARLLAHATGALGRDDWASFLSRPIGGPTDAGGFGSHPELRRLDNLLRPSGVSGDEGAVVKAVRSELPAWAQAVAHLDERGNLIVPLGSDGPPEAIFIAHMDEIGFTVTRAAADGRLTLRSEGGLSEDLFASQALYSPKGPATLLRSAQAQAAPGTLGEGDTLTPRKQSVLLGRQRITARSLDDRIGCYVLAEALNRFPQAPKGRSIWVVFSVEEETGLHGAAHIAQQTSPERVYPIDSFVTSDSPLEPKRIAYAPLGSGAVLRAVDNSGATPRQAVDRVLQLARDNSIPLQIGVTAGGNDGSTFTASGAVNIPLAFPLRYSHTAVEVADLRDVRALLSLVQVLLLDELGLQ